MNQSFKEAAELLSDTPSQYEIERAKVLATLALASEQKTGNLIALAELKRKDRASGSTAASTEIIMIIMIIEDRLDIGL